MKGYHRKLRLRDEQETGLQPRHSAPYGMTVLAVGERELIARRRFESFCPVQFS